ncbi:MAG: VOC family protein [Gemmatimonadota bacterium]
MSSADASQTQRTEPESLRARSLMASLTVNDLERSAAWYRDVVLFTVADEYEHEGKRVAVHLVAGDVHVLLNQDDGAKGERVKGQGFSLTLNTVQDVDALAARIRERGGELLSEPADMPWGARVFRLRDPDGFLWSISASSSGA